MTSKELCKQNYGRSWTAEMIAKLVSLDRISSDDFEEITGYAYGGYIPADETLADYQAAKIAASKTQLAEHLAEHPLTYTDGKQYSVTAEKQSLLTSALARYQIATASGVPTTLKWNATGEECTEWEYNDLAALALAIAAYVEPLVAQQQAAEVAINACTSVAEVEAIAVAYGS